MIFSKARAFIPILACAGTLIHLAFADLGSFEGSTLSRAKLLIGQKKWVDAAALLKQEVDANPRSIGTETLELYAESLLRSGRREEAIRVLSQIGNRTQKSVYARVFFSQATFQVYQEGVNYLLAKKIKPAKDRFQRALEQEPQNIEILLRLAQSLILDEDAKGALTHLNIATKLDAELAEVHLWLGRALQLTGKTNQAIEEYKLAKKNLGISEWLPLWLSEAYASQGSRMTAQQTLENDLQKNPNHLSCLVALAKLKIDTTKGPLKLAETKDSLWSARKDIQLGLSRIKDHYLDHGSFESELGVEFKRTSEEFTQEFNVLLKKIEGRLHDVV